MALALCNTTVDSRGRELVEHGTAPFPVACYYDDLEESCVPWHWHEELEAVLVTQGRCTVTAGNEKYVIETGEGFFINSGVLHGCWDLDGSHCRFHSLVFHPRLVGGSINSIYHQKYILPILENHELGSLHLKPEVPYHRRILEAIEEAWQACFEEPEGYEFQVRNALSELVWVLLRCLPPARTRSRNKAFREGERIKIMLQYIQDHFDQELSVGLIAASAAISESECLRCFRNTIGSTPIQYLRQYRLQQACLLLSATHEKIADISECCGFQDVSYFTKTFREQKGLVPSEYRKLHQK